jgi:hypothetical protein
MKTKRNYQGWEQCPSPKCNSVHIQYDSRIHQCYCLHRDCNHRWNPYNAPDFDINNIQNPYLRASLNEIPSPELIMRLRDALNMPPQDLETSTL